MKKICYFVLSVLGFSTLQAQVGINTTAPKSTLHVVPTKTDGSTAEGIIAPNLTRAQVISKDSRYSTDQRGAIVYVTALDGVLTTKTINIEAIGYYYFDGTIWQRFQTTPGSFIYMPSFNLNISSTGIKTKDLYAEYKSQFTKAGNAQFVSSDASLDQITPILASNDIIYTVTNYDTSVITVNNISTTGVMTYTVNDTDAPLGSSVNIILTFK